VQGGNVSIGTAAVFERWSYIAANEERSEKDFAASFPRYDTDTRSRAATRPWLALAKAKLGDIKGAEAVITTATPDSYLGMRVHGMIAAGAKQWGRADWWFARAVADNPSIPIAYENWGRSLLERGQADAAIEKFKLSNQKGPHFADPLEGWGEALITKNQSHKALEKFAEAEKYAPNWGRLHLKWGEALAYSGNKDEAAKQFARAAALDLTPSEKFELAKVSDVR
jgi:predicted Zn-dependent protease